MRLTRDEILLLASIAAALVVGALVKHWRDQRRLSPPAPAVRHASLHWHDSG